MMPAVMSTVRMQLEISLMKSLGLKLVNRSHFQDVIFFTFDKLPVFEDFCLMKVYKHLCMRFSPVDFSDNCNSLIYCLPKTLIQNFNESKAVLHDS